MIKNNIVVFKSNLLLYPFGFYNNSVLCYFNSLIQTLLSCTSITEYLLNQEEKIEKNNFLKIYLQIIKKYINNDNSYSNYLVDNTNILLFNEFIKLIKNKNINFGYNQEDSGELLLLLLEMINDTYINHLFLHKYKCDIYCKNCKNIVNIESDSSILFKIGIEEIDNNYLQYTKDKELNNLNKYIRNNYSDLENYICNKCKNLNNNIKINRLLYVPTIIVINLNKYTNKFNYQYPLELQFLNNSLNNIYKYKLISTINHSGNNNFGHYVTKAIRKNHEFKNYNDNEYDIYLLNDTSYQKNNFKSDIDSYILFYHYIETIDNF